MRTITILLTFLVLSQPYAQNKAVNAPMLGIHGSSAVFFGNNHHGQDLRPGLGLGASAHFNLKQIGISLHSQRTSSSVRDNALIYSNATAIQNRLFVVSLGYNLAKETDLLEPRMSIGALRTIYKNSFRTNQGLLALGFKYARCISSKGFFISCSVDMFWNYTKNIAAPEEYIKYMNIKQPLIANIGVEYRLFKNR